jgi:eukaryotic-like serine/threonine-protein kinase
MGTYTLAPGTVLGRYELLLPIAQGGMATVWAARQRGSRGFARTVAIKTILPSLSDDATFEQMFLDEAAIASRIHHPNVVEIYDLGEEDEVLYLVMEWVDGEALSTLAKQAKKNGDELPLRVTLRILAQACAGLHAAHELRDDHDQLLHLVHRDISPQNILVSSAGASKLVDFGVAKSMAQGGQTTVGQLKGKVPFMSPEQARGADLDRRTDIFAMGTILYRLATGTHPFMDDSDVRTMRNIITRPVIPPRTKNPRITPELDAVIQRALQKEADRRYQTAAEMGADLENAMLSLGGLVTVEEVATYVRATLGDRDRKRRAAIRDAVLKIDEQAAASTQEPRESVSSILLTQTSTPPAQLGEALHAGATLLGLGEPGLGAELRQASSSTLQAVSTHDDRRRGQGRTIAAIGGLLLTAGAIAAGIGLWRDRAASGGTASGADPSRPAAASAIPGVHAEAEVPSSAASGVAGDRDADAESEDPAFSIDELPDADALGDTRGGRPGRRGTRVGRIDAPGTDVSPPPQPTSVAEPLPRPSATATATSTPVAPTATATAQPTPSAPTTNEPPRLPSVQDPGF